MRTCSFFLLVRNDLEIIENCEVPLGWRQTSSGGSMMMGEAMSRKL